VRAADASSNICASFFKDRNVMNVLSKTGSGVCSQAKSLPAEKPNKYAIFYSKLDGFLNWQKNTNFLYGDAVR
jgi:hypothetical protein